MILGKERTVDLRGVYSDAAVLWLKLPSGCRLKNRYLNCGYIDTVLSEPLLKLFDIQTDLEAKRRLIISVYSLNDSHNRGMARVFAEVGDTRVVFSITSTGGGENDARRLTLERDYGDGTGDIIQVKDGKRDGFVIKALSELADLEKGDLKRTDGDLLCWSCTAKVNGLPGSVV